ncbi:DUF58 domain-containing protein [Candidatus Pacearchaeota archaeon]|nr:DUF58 domain-containing protein [Candidatus Pacearchaeota archaeon]
MGNLNINPADAISELEAALHRFMIKRVLYRILFRGKGLEFDGYRDYSPDEDAEDIDWVASLRAQKILARKYIEERDLHIFFVIDVSDDMVFGSTDKLKCEYAAEMVLALSHLIMNNGDNVGFVLFSDGIKRFIPPKNGRNHFFLLIDSLRKGEIYGGPSHVAKTLNQLLNELPSNTNAVFVVSDFFNVGKEHEHSINLFSARFETIGMMVRDFRDESLEGLKNELYLEDPETGKQIIVDPKLVRYNYRSYTLHQEKMVENFFKNSGADFIKFLTNAKFAPRFAAFLKERVLRKAYIVPRG